MRRLPVLLTTLALAFSGVATQAPAHAAAAGAGAALFQGALVTTQARVGGRLFMYLAGGTKGVADNGTQFAFGFAARGPCISIKRKQFKMTMCTASFRPHEIADEDFTFDPALDSAHLRLHEGKDRASVAWTGRGDRQPDAGPEADPGYGAYAYADVYRDAKAKGVVLGRRIETGHFGDWSFLDEGADAEVSTHGPLKFWRTADGRYHVRLVRRTRIQR